MLFVPSVEDEREARSQVFAIADHAKHILHALIASFRLAALVNLANGQLQEARVGQHEAVIIFFDP